MKKAIFAALFFILIQSAFPDYVGKVYVSYDPLRAEKIKVLSLAEDNLNEFFEREILRGNLVLRKSEEDSVIGGMEHRRYSQLYQGIPVFGGEIIQHLRNSRLLHTTGNYYSIDHVDLNPSLSAEEATKIFQKELGQGAILEKAEDITYVIFPLSDGNFRLCYQVRLKKDKDFYETGIVDAENGKIYARDTNMVFAGGEIGLGIDYHGYKQKFPTYEKSGVYYLYDDKEIRPYVQAILDYRTGGYVPSDNDNYWDHDGTSVSGHTNVGFVYDFYYLFLGRKGMDNNNMDTYIITHSSQYGYSDNASWNGVALNFFVPGKRQAQYAAALDVVSHEFSHGVTDYCSDLVYEFQSGALNESFSDIMGHAAEFYWHPAGIGFYRAEWLNGEDAFPSYEFGISNGYVRSAEDPNRFSQTGWYLGPDPCHLSQYYNLPFSIDRGGVHINCTIYPHACYLLAAGGTNRISGIRVSGIGLEKATKIYYRAWVYYLTKTSTFIDAANAILQSAYDLYGASSNEFAQAKQSMRAIGWIVY